MYAEDVRVRTSWGRKSLRKKKRAEDGEACEGSEARVVRDAKGDVDNRL